MYVPAPAVRRHVRQRRQAAGDDALGGARGRFAHDLADALPAEASAADVLQRESVRSGGATIATQAVDVRDELLDEVGAQLHLTDAGLRLAVRDTQARAARIMQPHIAEPNI